MAYTLSPATPTGNPINTILIEFSHDHGDADITSYTEKYLKCKKEDLDTLEIFIRFLNEYFDSMDTENGTSYIYPNGECEFEIDDDTTLPITVKQHYSELSVTINGCEFKHEFEHDRVYQDDYCMSGVERVVYYDDCGNEFIFNLE